MLKFWSVASVLLSCTLAFSNETEKVLKLFPKTKDIPSELKTPPGTVVGHAPDGTPLIDGKPRYLIGVKICSGSPIKDLQPRPGYPEAMKWLYEHPMSLETAHRMGFDFVSVNGMVPDWINHLAPEAKRKRWDGFEVLFKTGLPLHLDLGGFAPWETGLFLSNQKLRKLFPDRAYNFYENAHGNHWMPYSVFSPEGRNLYLDRWEFGVKEAIACGANLMRVEIFNEPSYSDYSDFNRAQFALYLKKKYGSVAAMNRNWKNSTYASFEDASKFKNFTGTPGLCVDWSKFLEEGVTSLCREGAERIRKIKPGLSACFQSRGSSYFRYLPDTHHNLYEVHKHMGEISTGTAGGVAFSGALEPARTGVIDTPNAPWVGEGMLQLAFLRALADGKSIHDDETYLRKNDEHGLYQEFLRGVNQITIFEFSKRAWDWKDEKTGRAQAARRSWMILNPYALPYAEFAKIMRAKKDILGVSDLFAPRTRNVERPVAMLFSYPTERYSGATGNLSSAYAYNVMNALSFTHYATDVILEEQLPSGRADRYRVLIAAGVKNTFDKTPEHLKKWIEKGGIFIALLDPVSENEYGFAHKIQLCPKLGKAKDDPIAWNFARNERIPGKLSGFHYASVADMSGWEKTGSSSCRRKLGKGWIYYIGTRYSDYSLASVLGGILKTHNVSPECEILNAEKPSELAPNIETATAVRDGFSGVLILNHDKYPKLVSVKHSSFKPGTFVLESFDGELLPVRDDSSVLLALGAASPKCLISGSRAKLALRNPHAKKRLEMDVRKLFATLPRPAKKSGFGYTVTPSAMKMLDLRKHVNREFRDSVPGDGRGGWTDQGAGNSLQEVPFGIQNFLNVPCDIIRWDMNGDKTCIVLDSTKLSPGFGVKQSGEIEVHEKTKALYFFHASAWGDDRDGKEVMYYLIRYKSGKTLRVPVRHGKEIAGWFRVGNRKNVSKTTPIAWCNSARHGFVCWRWENPTPADEIVSLSVHAIPGATIGIVIAITAEKDMLAGLDSIPVSISRHIPFGMVSASRKDGFIHISVQADARPFAGFRLASKTPWLSGLSIAPDQVPVLAFDVERGPGAMGGTDNGKTPLSPRVNGGKYLHRAFRPEYGGTQTITYSFNELMPDRSKWNQINEIYCQYRGVPTYGVKIGNFRILLEAKKK